MKISLLSINIQYKLVLVTLLLANYVFAQQHDPLYNQANEFAYSNPSEALKIGDHLLKNSKSNSEKSNFYLLLAQAYLSKGDYNNTVVAIYNSGKMATSTNQKIEVLLFKSELLGMFYLDEQASIYFQKAAELIDKIQSKDVKDYFVAKRSIKQSKAKIAHQKPLEALAILQKNDKHLKSYLYTDEVLQNEFNTAKAASFIAISKLDSAQIYLDKIWRFSNDEFKNNSLNKISVLRNYASFYFIQKQHDKAIECLLEAKKLSQSLGNLMLIEPIDKQLSYSYLAINDKINHQLIDKEFLKLHTNNEVLEQEAVNTAYNLISQEQEDEVESNKSGYLIFLYFVYGIFIMTVIIGTLIWYKSCSKNKRLIEIIKYLQISRNNSLNIISEKKENTKRIAIPYETEQSILSKLKRFESSKKFTNNEMSLAVLAGQFETNTKYLSEIINKHYQDNFNTYINKLRINFIIDKLKNDPNYMHYKISYLAEKSGFSSHSNFATVFKSITKIAPVTFIELLKEETEKLNKESTNNDAE